MIPENITNMLPVISSTLLNMKIPFCLIGAFALGEYGLPRYTSDIDLLSEEGYRGKIFPVMEKLGYVCYQETGSFVQFDSEAGVYGKVDFMLVSTQKGKDIIKRSFIVNAGTPDSVPVIQPTDYVILKLMAIANSPDRSIKDESDISTLFNLLHNNLLPQGFNPIDKKRIMAFADRFGQKKLIMKYLADI